MRTAPLHIGATRLRELPALAKLQRRAFPPRLAYSLGALAILWAIPWVRMVTARRGGEIVGCVIGDRTPEGGRVVNLAVDPAARRQGIGTALLAEIERVLSGGDLTLMVEEKNEGARALYCSVGYADDASLPNFYGPARHGVQMRKTSENGL